MAIENVANTSNIARRIRMHRILSDRLAPRFRYGECVITDTGVEPSPGDEVVITLTLGFGPGTTGGGIVAELKARNDETVQFTPLSSGKTVTLQTFAVQSIVTITGMSRAQEVPA